MRYSIFQMDIKQGNPRRNRDIVKKWIENEVSIKNPDVIVLPEMWTTAYTLDSLENIADRDGEPTKSFLSDLSSRLNVNIIGGSVANKVGEKFYNTALVYNRSGELVYEYSKIHLVPMLNEPEYLTGGEEPPEVFELEGTKMGLIICYDLRFPEPIRSLALEGAQVLHVVAEWPDARIHHWRNLQIARAIENQMYVVSSNRVGTCNEVTFGGSSMIVDPMGNILTEGTKNEEMTLNGQLFLEKLKQVREDVPIFKSRVPHIYKNIR